MRAITVLMAAVIVVSSSAITHGDNTLSYADTVAFIRDTMATNTSGFRKESYPSITFEGCKLSYNVTGTYPAGGSYDIKYSNIDLSSLNATHSKTGHDYTAFLVLNFNKDIIYKSAYDALKIRTIVMNVSDDVASNKLLNAFLHFGELCSAERSR